MLKDVRFMHNGYTAFAYLMESGGRTEARMLRNELLCRHGPVGKQKQGSAVWEKLLKNGLGSFLRSCTTRSQVEEHCYRNSTGDFRIGLSTQ